MLHLTDNIVVVGQFCTYIVMDLKYPKLDSMSF